MAMDQRDYWIDRLRKRTGYRERARFRMSEAEIQRQRNRRGWLVWLLAAASFLLAAWLLGRLLRS